MEKSKDVVEKERGEDEEEEETTYAFPPMGKAGLRVNSLYT